MAAATGHQLFRLGAEVPVTDGSTIRNIEAGLHIETERLRTDLGEPRVVILSPTANQTHGSRLAGRAAICRVPVAEGLVRPIALAEGSATGPAAREGIA